MPISRLRNAFSTTPAFVAYITAGYPQSADTVPAMLALEAGGASVIEIGVPFSDPMADGPTIQRANTVAVGHGVTLQNVFDMVKEARSQGLRVPVVLMGYFNPIVAFGERAAAAAAASAGVDGFLVVDLPFEEGFSFISACRAADVSYVPLVAPTTTPARVAALADVADSFIYCVSLTGVTGARSTLPPDLAAFVARVKAATGLPVAVGFGISTPAHVRDVGAVADGVVVGSALVAAMRDAGEDAPPPTKAAALKALVASLLDGTTPTHRPPPPPQSAPPPLKPQAHGVGFFGDFGGRFIPETLVAAHEELSVAYAAAQADPAFREEVARLRREFVGGPTPLYFAERLTAMCGGAQIYFKREELAHTGAHKINNALGQALLAKRLGKSRIIAETGAGQHGVATATACALLGLACVVYMGATDVERQSLNVFKMKMLGARVVAVDAGSRTLKDAINEAMRDWVTNVGSTHYIIGSAIGPHPFPTIVRDFQAVIGLEARAQMLEKVGRLPDVVVACVGGGSNAIGMFHPFVPDAAVRLVGVEAGGHGVRAAEPGEASVPHSATLTGGTPGVLHGTRTYLLQDGGGQITETHSISAGLDYPGVGPEHAWLKASGRATYVAATDAEALEAMGTVSRTEGIIPALEPSHALAWVIKAARGMKKEEIVLVNVCGRGDKDMISVAKALGVTLN